MPAFLHPPPESDDDWDTFWNDYVKSRDTLQRATIAKQEVCLAAYREVGTLKAGVEACSVTYDAAMQWRERDAHYFRRRLLIAQNDHADKMEALMYERLEDPQGNRGSDPLLMFALKGARPEKWRELPVIIASDTSREIQEKLVKMVSEGMKRRAAVRVERTDTAEARVERMLGPGKAEEQPGS